MKAITKASEPAGRLLPVVDVLAIRAETRAFLWWHWIIATMPDAVDDLQAYAERAGLVEQFGRDRIQAIIAAPFARYFNRIEQQAAEQRSIIARGMAVEDTGPQPPPEPKREYRTPRATIDAFFHVARNESTDCLARWLKDHPLDAPQLLKIWKAKCTAAST